MRQRPPLCKIRLFYPSSGGTLTGKEAGYFLPYDAEVERFPRAGEKYITRRPGNALAMDSFLLSLSRLQPKHILLAMDSCFSGFASRRADFDRQTGPLNERRLAKWASEDVVQVLTAGGAGELASEHPTYGQGVFTYHLLRGLKGNADSAGGSGPRAGRSE